jgi:hypothetical protein
MRKIWFVLSKRTDVRVSKRMLEKGLQRASLAQWPLENGDMMEGELAKLCKDMERLKRK